MRAFRPAALLACAGLLMGHGAAESAGELDSIPAPLYDPGTPAGQPPRWRLSLGPLAGYDFRDELARGRLFLDAEGRIAMPQFGLLDAHFEGALDFDEERIGTAIGAYAKLPYVRVGVERDIDDHRFDLVLSTQASVRRGGMFRRGERLRIDYSPTAQRVQIGFQFNTPWMRYRATRPYRIHVDLPRGRLPAPVAADVSGVAAGDLLSVEHAIDWLERLLTPHLTPKGFYSGKGRRAFDREMNDLLEHQRQPGHDFAAEDSAYHAALDLAFARAAGGAAAGEWARTAEKVILEEVVIPFNRHFGRPRRPGGLGGLAAMAQTRFDGLVRAHEPPLDESQALAAREIFRRVVRRIDAAARSARHRWKDSSLAWLPLNYGLRPDQYDSQAEIEAVLGLVLGEPFTDANSIHYVLNDQFYYQLRDTILKTRVYHVLWIHDFRGLNKWKAPDRVAWSQVTEGYIEALTASIKALDRGELRDLPVFLIFLDEHYYQVNESRRLLTLLERLPAARPPRLKDDALGKRLEESLGRLQEAIRDSPVLRARGEEYVRRRVRVQIHITYPLDPSYAGDILMRDHRKIAFCDASEEDPAAGCGVFTGEGVGEHYQGPYWEDRSLVVRGPEILRLKAAARRLLRSQGFREAEIPWCLRERGVEGERSPGDSLRASGWNAHLLTALNETGWGPKPATILKAALYNLMPAGACIVAPDSLWTSDFWAGMFVAAARRGCRVYVIAPARDHAPSNALPTMGLMQETLAVLLEASRKMAPDLERSGGELHVGLYTRQGDVSDMKALLGSMLEAPERPGFFPGWNVHPEVVRALQAEYDTLRSAYTGPAHPLSVDEPGHPQIHLKAQFFASPEALGILSRREWGPILARYLAIRRRQTTAPDRDIESITPALLAHESPGDSSARDVCAAHLDSLAAADPRRRDRVFYLATLGSHNQDRRSMLLDGEVLVAVSGPAALTVAMDFACLIATATWIDDPEELKANFPESSGFMKRMRRWIRNLI